MRHLLPIIKTALNRLQPPLKHAAYSPPSPPPQPCSSSLNLLVPAEIRHLPRRQLPSLNSPSSAAAAKLRSIWMTCWPIGLRYIGVSGVATVRDGPHRDLLLPPAFLVRSSSNHEPGSR